MLELIIDEIFPVNSIKGHDDTTWTLLHPPRSPRPPLLSPPPSRAPPLGAGPDRLQLRRAGPLRIRLREQVRIRQLRVRPCPAAAAATLPGGVRRQRPGGVPHDRPRELSGEPGGH